MSQWYPTIAAEALATDSMKNLEVAGQAVLLVNAGGDFFATDPLCTHDDIALSLGCIKDKTIRCSLHGAVFNLADGAVLADPAETSLTTWPVRVVDGMVEIQI